MLTCVFLFCLIAGNAVAAGETVVTQELVYIPVYVGNTRVDSDMLSYSMDGELYVPLEEVSKALGSWFYTWNSALQSASLMAEGLFLTVSSDEDYIIANGRYLYMKNGLQMRNGEPMVPVQQLCRAFGVSCALEDAVRIEPEGQPIEAAAQYYNEEDIYWLSRIIYAEAGAEPFEGMIAVGNVVLNRVASEEFPDTVYDVIFDFANGIQFSPAYYGTVYCTPSEDAIMAAKLAMDGVDVVGDCLYFNATRLTNSWASQNCEFVTQIGDHNFYV